MADSKKGDKRTISERELDVRNKITAAFFNASGAGLFAEKNLSKARAERLETDIRKRMKELQCLYTVSSITQNQNSLTGDVLQEIVDCIPAGMQFQEIAYARLIAYNNEYKTENYKDTEWKTNAKIKASGETIGSIETGYLENISTNAGKPFSDEEIRLISAIADLTGIYFERKYSQQMFQNLADNSPISIYIVQDRKFQYVNPQFIKSCGYSEDELLNMNYSALVFPEDRANTRRLAVEMIKGQSHTPYEFRVVSKDGSIKWIMESISSIQYNGRPATIGSHLDITEFKNAEESLRESEEFNFSLLENSPYQISVINPDTSIRYINPAFEKANGWTLEEIIGMKAPYPWWPKGNTEERLARFKGAIERGSGKTEIPAFRKDGRRYWLEMYWSPIIHDGELKYTLVNAVDITEHKKADEELTLRAKLLDNAGDSINVLDLDGNIIYVNQVFFRSLGYSREELIGMNITRLVQQIPGMPIDYWLKKIIEKGDIVFEITHLRKDGSPVQMEIHSLITESGGNKLILNVERDITERIRNSEQLMVTDRLAAIGELSSGIAHEINNPLTGIIGFSDLLMEGDIPDEIRADLEVINREARRTADIVKKLLAFARKHPEKTSLVDLNKIIDDVLEMRKYEQQVNNIEVIKNYDSNLPAVLADGFELQQVFMNLVVNAEYFMTEKNGKGTLTVTTKLTGNYVQASLADDGPGIKKEYIGQIFNPFFTTKEVGKGTGLGLSICHGIITKYNGRINVISEPGKGATFTIELPAPVTGEKEKV